MIMSVERSHNKFLAHLCSITGVGERLHKILGQIR